MWLFDVYWFTNSNCVSFQMEHDISNTVACMDINKSIESWFLIALRFTGRVINLKRGLITTSSINPLLWILYCQRYKTHLSANIIRGIKILVHRTYVKEWLVLVIWICHNTLLDILDDWRWLLFQTLWYLHLTLNMFHGMIEALYHGTCRTKFMFSTLSLITKVMC